jgi:hypothetical protein
MSHTKQTALQWFKDVTYPYLDKESKEYVDILFNHALQMEHEQIIDAYVECYMNHVGNGESILREANSYYKNTYGGQNESNFN